MGPTEINGLPAHVLLVHVVVVMIPLASLALVLAVLWPAARRRLGVVTPILALVALVFVPVTTHAGEFFASKLGGTSPALEEHEHLGDQLLPYVIGLFVVAAAHWVWTRWVLTPHAKAVAAEAAPSGSGGVAVAERTQTATPTKITVGNVVFAVLGIAAAVLSVWMVYRVGDSGAKAAWGGIL